MNFLPAFFYSLKNITPSPCVLNSMLFRYIFLFKKKNNIMPPKSPTKVRAAERSSECYMPIWATLWAIVGSLVCIWDATYVLTRPRSMANGDLFHIFVPYAKYITVDPLYGDLKNAFVIGQSYMNLIELTLALLSVVVYHLFGRRNLMTWSKTVLYFIHDHFERSLHPQESPIHVELWEKLLLFIVPSSFWVILPFACMWSISRQILRLLNSNNGKTKTN